MHAAEEETAIRCLVKDYPEIAVSKVLVLDTAALHLRYVRNFAGTNRDPNSRSCHFSASFPSAGGPGVVSHNLHLFATGLQPDLVIYCC